MHFYQMKDGSSTKFTKIDNATNGGVAEPAWGQIAYVWTLEQ